MMEEKKCSAGSDRKKEGLLVDVKVWTNFGAVISAVVDFKILRGGSKAK